MTTGIIGIGSMGMAMARNLHRKGLDLLVHDVRADALQAAAASGIKIAATPAEIAGQCDLIIIVVVNAKQIAQVLSDAQGVLAAEADLHGKTVMLCSTIAPEETIHFAEQLAAHHMQIIDAPISGGPIRAEAGSMSIMVAGEPACVAKHHAVLDALSDKIFQLGAVIGDGARFKLVNNLLAGINLAGAAEALSLGIKLGLDPLRLLDLMRASSGQSMMLEDRMTRALADDFAPRAFAHILTKDVALGIALAKTIGHDTALGDQALALLTATLARGYSELDDAAVLKTSLN
jgi:3-hydroxyisobutyrate dehydrogenase